MFNSLRARLIGICVAITVAALFALALATFIVVRNNTLHEMDQHMGQLTHNHANELAEWLKEKQRITSSLKLAVGQAEPVPFLLAAKEAGAFDDTYFVYADNRSIFSHPLPEGYSGTARPWYQQAIQVGGPALTPAYVDASTGKLTISFVEPVGPQGKPTAVVGSDIHLDSITRKVNAIHPTPNNFAFLVDGGGNILAHTKTEYALKPVTTIAPKLDQTMLRQLADNGGRASLPIDGKAQALEDIASGEGDLTRRLDTQGNDELTQISQAFNHFLTSSPG